MPISSQPVRGPSNFYFYFVKETDNFNFKINITNNSNHPMWVPPPFTELSHSALFSLFLCLVVILTSELKLLSSENFRPVHSVNPACGSQRASQWQEDCRNMGMEFSLQAGMVSKQKDLCKEATLGMLNAELVPF